MSNGQLSNMHASRLHRRLLKKHAIDSLAISDQMSESSRSPGQMLQGYQYLTRQALNDMPVTSYFQAQFLTEIAAALLLLVGAGLAWLFIDAPGLMSSCAIAAAAATGVAVAYRAVTRALPLHLDAARVDLANRRPRLAGDDTRPLSLVGWMVATFVILAEGALAGLTITTAALGSVLTAEQVQWAALAWSIAIGCLIFHLAAAAARESCIAQRRHMICALLRSPVAAEQERGQQMFGEVCGALGGSLEAADNRTRARWALALVTLGLAVCVFSARMLAESSSLTAPGDLAPEVAAMPSAKP
jgi:multisubunit Na+/H+ antiporter MnhB subunit